MAGGTEVGDVDRYREVEDKYELATDATLPDLGCLPAVADVSTPRTHHLEATYFDTRDLRLAAAGITLRRRTGGDDSGWHLKLPTAGARHEIRLPLGRSRRSVPERLQTTVAAVTGGEKLGAVAVVETRRTTQDLLDGEGRILAEVADDRACARGPHRADETREWREVEVELVHGDADLRSAAATLLERAGAKPAAVSSKLARALGGRSPGPRALPPRSPDDEVSALVQARLAEQLDELLRSDPLVREDLPDGVHDMRVAARRLRSALATNRPFLGRDVTEPLRDELRWVGEVLGQARDPEVERDQMLGLLDGLTAEEPDDIEGVAAARLRIAQRYDERYRSAHERCVEALGSDRYLALVRSLEQLVARPAWTSRAHEAIDDAATRRVRREWKRVEARVKEVDGVDDAEGLHELRKAVRRMRYAVEPLRPVYGKPAARLAKRMKKVQDLLGAHNDTVTARSRLTGFSDAAAADGENAFVYGLLHARETDAARLLAAEFEETWPSASAKSRRRWLK